MISFNLRCSKEHEFEGWFKNGDAFEKQASANLIECPTCGDREVVKALSAPNISSGKMQTAAQTEQARALRDKLRALRHHVEANNENVGDRFAEEARKIHYGEAEARGIYGQVVEGEAEDLAEEGIPFLPLPWIEEAKDN